jgi:hypothetical protein
MPRGGGGGGIAGAIRDIAERKGRQADRERNNVDFAWREGIRYESSANLSKLQSRLRTGEIKVGGQQERKTAKTVAKQTRKTEAAGSGLRINEMNTEHKNTLSKGRADVRNFTKVAEKFEPGKNAAITTGNATGSGMLRKPAPTPKATTRRAAPTATAAQKTTAKKPPTPRKPPTAR